MGTTKSIGKPIGKNSEQLPIAGIQNWEYHYVSLAWHCSVLYYTFFMVSPVLHYLSQAVIPIFELIQAIGTDF